MDGGCRRLLHVRAAAGRRRVRARRRLVLAIEAVRRLFQLAAGDHQSLRTVERQPESYTGIVDGFPVGAQPSEYVLCRSRGDRRRLGVISGPTADVWLDRVDEVLGRSAAAGYFFGGGDRRIC